jgi:hypothetical protein
MGWFVSAVQVAGDLFKVRDQLRTARADRRKAIAEYFDAVSVALHEIHDALIERRRADFALGKLKVYAQQLPQICEGFITPDEAERLSRELAFYWPPGDLLEIMDDELLREDFPSMYAEASGKFKALADSIRAQP